MNKNFRSEFNTAVENAAAVIREARHMNLRGFVFNDVTKFGNFLHDVNFKMEFVDDGRVAAEDYVKGKMLDAMDYLKDELETYNYTNNERKVVNSLYDIVKEFYFDAPYTYGLLG